MLLGSRIGNAVPNRSTHAPQTPVLNNLRPASTARRLQSSRPNRRKTMPTLWTLALALLPSLFPTPNQSNLIFPPAGRWEIVHTGGDNISQTSIFPGGFSVFLNPDGTGYTFGTFAQSFCVVDAETNNVAPTWTRLDDNQIQITIAINNLGQGPNLSFVYTGTFDADTPIPGDPSRLVPTIRGTYFPIGDASLCSNA